MKTIVTETSLETNILFLLQLLMTFYSNILLGTYRLKEALPGYMDMAVYNVIMHFSTVMWLHFRNVATNMSYKVCSHISEM